MTEKKFCENHRPTVNHRPNVMISVGLKRIAIVKYFS